jgi:hypothetical protein
MLEESRDLLDPPKYDMLIVRFHGDDFDVVLPYCEVANGDFKAVTEESIHIAVNKGSKSESVAMSYSSFAEVVEKTFDTKEVVALAVHPKESYKSFKIL